MSPSPPAETWFGILFVTLVEVSPPRLKTSVLGVFLFLMNNVGGNLPVLLDPLSKALGYRSLGLGGHAMLRVKVVC